MSQHTCRRFLQRSLVLLWLTGCDASEEDRQSDRADRTSLLSPTGTGGAATMTSGTPSPGVQGAAPVFTRAELCAPESLRVATYAVLPSPDCENKKCGETCDPCAKTHGCTLPEASYRCDIRQLCQQVVEGP